jgi:hypothetical protein
VGGGQDHREVTITYERSGGFAGLRKRAFVDTATLGPAERAGWEQLIDAAQFFSLPATIPPGNPHERDAFNHFIRVERQGQQHEVRVTGTPASEPLRALVGRLAKLAH